MGYSCTGWESGGPCANAYIAWGQGQAHYSEQGCQLWTSLSSRSSPWPQWCYVVALGINSCTCL